MGSARKRRRLVGFRKRVDQDESLGRFGKLVGLIIVIELAVLFYVWAQHGILLRPLS